MRGTITPVPTCSPGMPVNILAYLVGPTADLLSVCGQQYQGTEAYYVCVISGNGVKIHSTHWPFAFRGQGQVAVVLMNNERIVEHCS